MFEDLFDPSRPDFQLFYNYFWVDVTPGIVKSTINVIHLGSLLSGWESGMEGSEELYLDWWEAQMSADLGLWGLFSLLCLDHLGMDW